MDAILKDNLDCLKQGLDLLDTLEPSVFPRPAPACFNSTIGGHFRHNFDHYTQFVEGLAAQEIDYDSRLRDNLLETDLGYAAGRFRNLVDKLEALDGQDLDLEVTVKMDSGSDAPDWSRSTIRRELQFLLSHSIHHYALIAVICCANGVATPKSFGVAPSTIRHQQANAGACAH